MIISKPRKVFRILYLYMTIPLLLITAVLAMTAVMSMRSHHNHHEPVEVAAKPSMGSAEAPAPIPPIVSAPEEEDSPATGTAAIITAILTGIAGVLAGCTQLLNAYNKSKGRAGSADSDSKS